MIPAAQKSVCLSATFCFKSVAMLAFRVGPMSFALLSRSGSEALTALASQSIQPSNSAGSNCATASQRCSPMSTNCSSTAQLPYSTAHSSSLAGNASEQPTSLPCAALSGLQRQATGWSAVSLPSSFRRSFASDKISELEAGETERDTPAEQPAAKPSVAQLQPAQLLKRMSVMRFREQLAAEAEKTPTISYQDLLARCQTSGAASSEEEAKRICSALADSGVVLQFADLIYLRPMEIAEYIVQALPGSQREVMERVDALRSELAPMEARKEEIDSRAHRWVRVLLWSGLLLFLTQWTLFLRLTFWELSWDVMEPVSYFVSSAGGIFAYCYFLATHEDFGYAPWRDRIASNLQVGGYAKKGLDLRRLQLLQRDVARLERFLKR